MNLVTVLTPTYNRIETLPKLYNSLCAQTNKNFKWLVVDDGSQDGTKEFINKISSEDKIDIEYVYQENKGKHFALNNGIKRVNTTLTLIVDSDDVLTKDAIESIEREWQPYDYDRRISGITFLRSYSEDECIGDRFPDTKACGYIDMRIKRNVKGDKAEIFRTDLLKQYPFPEIEGEKFIGEDIVWNDIAKHYKMAWCNQIIYITEYLEGGLTKSGRSLRVHCPIGGMLNSKMMLTHEFPIKFRIKKGILYNCYRHFMKKEDRKQYSYYISLPSLATIPLGWGLYLAWKKYY